MPTDWVASLAFPARYEIQFESALVTIQSCPYSGGGILTRDRVKISLTVTDLQTKQQVASRTFVGGIPPACPAQFTFGTGTGTSLTGDEPKPADVQSWLKATMSRFGLK